MVERALRQRRVGPYQLQAAIAAVHDEAASTDETDWVQILGLYEVLARVAPSPVVSLNRAVAVGIRDAVDELDATDDLRAGVLTGAGGTFSSGMDLKAFLKGEMPAFPGRGLCGITQTPPRKPLVGAADGCSESTNVGMIHDTGGNVFAATSAANSSGHTGRKPRW